MRHYFVWLTLAGLSLSAAAAEAESPAWPISCKGAVCTASRTLQDTTSGRPVATILFAAAKGSPDLNIGAALPLGIALDAGARFVNGTTATPLTFEVCFPDGCRAMTRAGVADAQALAAAANGFDLQFFPYGQEKPVAITVPSDGLAEALVELRKQADALP
ncbi:MAG: invasion associated locus B family protein [Paracoccaceae bacterium]